MYGRYLVLRQGSRIKDKTNKEDTTKALLKHISVRKAVVILYEFRAKHTGVVGCVFKYVDPLNFLTFEIGGSSNITKRFFRIRKIHKGTWTTIKKISTPIEVSFLPFFGYEANTWYGVRVEISGDNIKVGVGLLGVTKIMNIMNATDSSIKIGRIGFSTSGTEAAFSEIYVRPPRLPYSKL